MTYIFRQYLLLICVLFATTAAHAQTSPSATFEEIVQDGEIFVINLRDTDISILAEEVSKITGRTLILHPDLAGEITVVSAKPLDQAGVWSLFQSILEVRGFRAVNSGVIWQILPQDQVKANSTLSDAGDVNAKDFVTKLLRLEKLPSAEAVRILRPLVSSTGYLESVADPNAVLLTDTSDNVERISALLTRLDGEETTDSQIIKFKHADAETVRASIVEVLGPAGNGARISANASSNVLVVRGGFDDITEIRNLAREMDVALPVARSPHTHTRVFKLKFGDAESIAIILQKTLGGVAVPTNAVAEDQLAVAEPGRIQIQPSTEINAIVVNGTDAQLKDVGKLIAQLDKRRPQVIIEAAIAEVSGDTAQRLSVQLGFDAFAPPGGLATTSFGNGGASLGTILSALGVKGAAAVGSGLSIGATKDSFGVLVQALGQSSRANLLSTPSITTMDNKEASIVVGQSVPFVTGTFATNGNTAQPFTTIERQDVGIKLNVLPRITDGNVVRLDIAQEVSSLLNANVEGASDLITSKRSINTSVLVDNGSTIVLGGLISEEDLRSLNKVPGLADIPLLGELFKSRNNSKRKTSLFVFLRPTILRDATDVQRVVKQRYTKLRKAEKILNTSKKSTGLSKPVDTLPLEILGLY